MKLEVGVHVKINKTLKYTKESFGINDSMERSCGKIKKVEKNCPKGNEHRPIPYVMIDSWMWDIRDLEEAIPENLPEIKSDYFDPLNLI